MKTDEDIRAEESRFVKANAEILAEMADGKFIDLKVRPKSKRVKWSKDTYRKTLLANIDYWEKAPIDEYMRRIYGVKGFVLQALDNQFTRYRDIHAIYRQRTIDTSIDAKKKERTKTLRKEQADMEPFDINRKCLRCGMFVFARDERNNYRHKKDEVCSCGGSRHLQEKMKEKISAYRKSLEDRKKIKKKDPMRYKR